MTNEQIIKELDATLILFTETQIQVQQELHSLLVKQMSIVSVLKSRLPGVSLQLSVSQRLYENILGESNREIVKELRKLLKLLKHRNRRSSAKRGS
jgi:hypothetical protein